MWDQWKRTTQFVNSARLALSRESLLWSSLEIADETTARLRSQFGRSEYEVRLDEHRKALADEDILCAMALLHSYAIAESAVAEKLGKETDEIGQIEVWGQKILDAASKDWSDVMDGKAGIVELTVYRNAIAHGSKSFEARHVNRMRNVPSTPTWKEGDVISMNHDLLKTFRARLKSLLRRGEVKQMNAEELKSLRKASE